MENAERPIRSEEVALRVTLTIFACDLVEPIWIFVSVIIVNNLKRD